MIGIVEMPVTYYLDGETMEKLTDLHNLYKQQGYNLDMQRVFQMAMIRASKQDIIRKLAEDELLMKA